MLRGNFHQAPVPIRLSCRDANGVALSFGARAQSCDDDSLRVLCSQLFDPGIPLQVAARFLEGCPTCRVAGVRRSSKHRPSFELDLEFVEKTVAEAPEAKEVVKAVVKAVVEEKAGRAGPAELIRAAGELAGQLERNEHKPLSQVFEALPSAAHPLALIVCPAALLRLLGEKNAADGRRLLAAVRERRNP